jgi:hypothetical protein
MGKETQIIWTCDICGAKTTTKEGMQGAGWSTFDVEDTMEERCWHHKAVCPGCVKKVTEHVVGPKGTSR